MQNKNDKRSYVWGLDLIRFAASLMVLLFHFSWRQERYRYGFDAGWVGVEIFFVISGFVIMGSAIGGGLVDFAERRIARLYPAAIGCAFLNIICLVPFVQVAQAYHLSVSAAPRAFIDSLLLINGPFLVSALWTLPIELAFYGLIFLLLFTGRIERLVVAFAAALIVWSGLYLVPFCLSEYGVIPFHVDTLGYQWKNMSMLRHGCFFGVGILLWRLKNDRGGITVWLWLALGVALGGVEIVARSAELKAGFAHPVDLVEMAISALGTFAFAVWAIHAFGRWNDRFRPGPAALSLARLLGLMTYPLYLMHEGVGGVTFGLLRQRGFTQGIGLLAGLAFSLAASWLVVTWLEPWLRLRLMAVLKPILVRARARLQQ